MHFGDCGILTVLFFAPLCVAFVIVQRPVLVSVVFAFVMVEDHICIIRAVVYGFPYDEDGLLRNDKSGLNQNDTEVWTGKQSSNSTITRIS